MVVSFFTSSLDDMIELLPTSLIYDSHDSLRSSSMISTPLPQYLSYPPKTQLTHPPFTSNNPHHILPYISQTIQPSNHPTTPTENPHQQPSQSFAYLKPRSGTNGPKVTIRGIGGGKSGAK